jgi:dTDP-4-dehydrorhamnose reductase
VRLHVRAPTLLAEACAARGVRLGLLSSSLVLPTPGPHAEEAATAPRTRLGAAQARGERLALERHPGALLARCGVVVGLDRPDDPISVGFSALHAGKPWIVPDGASAVVASLLAHALLDLIVDGERGIWHLAHRRPLVELARSAARLAGLDAGAVQAAAPGGARLTTARGEVLPSCGPALHGIARRHPRSARSHPTPEPANQRHQQRNEP